MKLDNKYKFKLIDLGILSILLFVFLYQLDLSLVFTNTHISGGDTISHPWISRSLKDLWLGGSFWGWNDGWSAGIPFLYFYFYPVYILVNIYTFIGVPELISFKLMVFTLISLVPITYYLSGRKWLSRPYALLFSALGIFLFFSGNFSYYGGNLKSLLAGQMSHQFGLLMLVAYCSYLFKKDIHSKGAIFFLSLSVISHVYSALFAIIFTLGYYLLEFLKDRDYKKTLLLPRGAFIGMGATAFFWIPFLYYRNDTVSPINQWVVDTNEFINVLQLKDPWYMALYGLSSLLMITNLFNKKSVNRFYLLFLWAIALLSAASMPYLINTPFLHIRLVPEIFIISIIVLIASLSELLKSKRYSRIVSVFFTTLILQSFLISESLDKVLPKQVRQPITEVLSWWSWNMSGIEAKANNKDVFELWDFIKKIKDDEGRFAFEYFDYNSYGSPRIFELTPFVTGKSVFEGLLLESSPNYPASYYINFLVKRESWWPGFPVTVPEANIEKAVQAFSLYNMKYFVSHSKAITDLLRNRNFKILFQNKGFSVFLINPDTTVAAAVLGDIPVFKTRDRLMASVLNFPNSLENIAIIEKGESTEAFPKKTNQELKPIYGYWDAKKQKYTVPITDATKEKPKKILFKISYFPNWKTSTGEQIKLVSPNLMLVETSSPKLEIVYKSGIPEKFGFLLSIFTLITLIWGYARKSRRFHSS